jgi:hypothetical protein
LTRSRASFDRFINLALQLGQFLAVFDAVGDGIANRLTASSRRLNSSRNLSRAADSVGVFTARPFSMTFSSSGSLSADVFIAQTEHIFA